MKLTHPDSTKPIEVKAEHADAYLSQGWTEADEKPVADAPDPKK